MSADPAPPLSDAEQKSRALDVILEAWDRALRDGVAPEYLASTAIFAALTDMIDIFGAEPVAEMCAGLPARVRAGEFSLGGGQDAGVAAASDQGPASAPGRG